MANNILKFENKKFALVSSIVMLILSAINLFLIIFFAPKQVEGIENLLSIIPFTTSLLLMIVSMVVYGIMTIRVFLDYKKQNRLLCANGIAYICVVALSILIFGFVIATMAGSNINSVYVYTVIFGLFAFWNVFYAVYGFKNKYKNAFFSIAYAILEVAYSIFATLAINAIIKSEIVITTYITILTVISIILVVCFALDMLITYVLGSPDYLINEETLRLVKEDEMKKQEKKAKLNSRLASYLATPETETLVVKEQKTTEDDIETKLKKLDSLLEKKLITDEEYKQKKQEILDEL